MSRRLLIAFAWCLSVSFPAFAARIDVPADFVTIQAAMDAAIDGDEVVVSPGLYVQDRTLDIIKKIVLRSTFDGSDWGIVEDTIIKASGHFQLIRISSFSVTLRGFRITRDPIVVTPGFDFVARGINSAGAVSDVEFNIIENHVSVVQLFPIRTVGAAIIGIDGVIQNNIIRNNRADAGAALYQCDGLIRNNLIYSNTTGLSGSSALIVNNTIFDSRGIAGGGGATVINNIFWQTAPGEIILRVDDVSNCIIKGYTGSGIDIITDDPRFVDPTNGDFRLQPTSPAIDAGAVTDEVSADFEGIQRGIKGNPALPGLGPFFDIGAYEFIPTPVAVWLPGGGPDTILAGDALDVAWQLETATAGTNIILLLFDDQSFVRNFGVFTSPAGAARSQILLPLSLRTADAYSIRGISFLDGDLTSSTPPLTIQSVPHNALPALHWTRY